jgi:cytoskeleton protein RodZ
MSQGPPARTVGARLREAREKRGVTLRQIANTTRISVMSLEALERSDLSHLPGGIFTRSFVRAYAQEVGLDPDRTIQDFIAELPPESTASTARSAAMEDGEQLDSDRKTVAVAMKLILLSLPIAGFVIYYGMHRLPRAMFDGSAPAASSTPTGGAPSMPGSSARATGRSDAAAPISTSGALPQPTGLAMEIAPKEDCWVSVTVDGEQVFTGLMHGGDRRQVAARDEISLSVGDAGVFAYTLNGKVGRPLGAPGEVVSKRITVADSMDYVSP